jgi:hypothetical protein
MWSPGFFCLAVLRAIVHCQVTGGIAALDHRLMAVNPPGSDVASRRSWFAVDSRLLPPHSPPPERGGRLAIKGDKCLSAASFCPPAKRLPGAGNPRSGPGDGVLFFCLLFLSKQKE